MVCLLREWKLVLVLEHEITYFRQTNRKTAIHASSLAKGFHVHSLPHKLSLGKGVDRLVLASQYVCQFL